MPVKAVIFDYGHTLLDFAPAEERLLDCYEEVLTMLRAEAIHEVPTAQALVDGVSRWVEVEIQRTYRERSPEELDIVDLFHRALVGRGLAVSRETARRIAVLEHRALVRDMAVPDENLAVLRELRARGLKTGLISNAHFLPEMMREDIERLGVAPHLDYAVFSSEVGIRKPHPRIFQGALTALGVSAADAVFVGDRVADDIGGAQAAGMAAVLTQQYRQEVPGPDGPQPNAMVSRLPDLPLVIGSLRNDS